MYWFKILFYDNHLLSTCLTIVLYVPGWCYGCSEAWRYSPVSSHEGCAGIRWTHPFHCTANCLPDLYSRNTGILNFLLTLIKVLPQFVDKIRLWYYSIWCIWYNLMRWWFLSTFFSQLSNSLFVQKIWQFWSQCLYPLQDLIDCSV